ncbi:hypothetical protein MW7_017310 [Imbroritus primus]|jgi:uncharacterized membrane protein YqjE|uniref:Uncharacterized protein n=1 Tax=Imbroritus primus TaxID=3058603 RepID=A0ACD3SKV8_9BURK|nr:hypothetical protein MW7_017310 [Burkholderiaceae bacterium PBA]
MQESTPSPRFFDSLRSLLGNVAAMARTRLELASVELAEEKARLMQQAFLGLLGLAFLSLGMIALTALIVILCWDTYRWQVLAGLVALYFGIAAYCLVRVRRQLQDAPAMFEATLAELDKDREALKS